MFMSNPDVDAALKVYNLGETEFLQDSLRFVYPGVKLHKVVHLPMMTDESKHEYNGFVVTVSSLSKNWKNFLAGGKDFESNYPTHKKGVDRGFKLFEDEYDATKYVKVRIISDVKFPVDWDEGHVLLSNQKPKGASLQSGFMMLKKSAQKNVKKSAGCCGLFAPK